MGLSLRHGTVNSKERWINWRNTLSGCSGIRIRRVDWTTVVTYVKHVTQ